MIFMNMGLYSNRTLVQKPSQVTTSPRTTAPEAETLILIQSNPYHVTLTLNIPLLISQIRRKET